MDKRSQPWGGNGADLPMASLSASTGVSRSAVAAERRERVRLLFENLPFSLTISGLLACILAAVLATEIRNARLFDWFAVLAAVLLARTLLLLVWRRRPDAGIDPAGVEAWLFWFRFGTIAAGMVWGVGGLLLAPVGDIRHEIYVSFALGGLCAGAAATLAVDSFSVVGFLLTVLVPQIVFLAMQRDAISQGMSAMETLFLFFLLASSRQSSRQLAENFRLRMQATDNEQRFRQMLESSPVATCIEDAANGRVMFANNSYALLIDTSPERAIGAFTASYYASPDAYAAVLERLGNGEQVTNQLVELHAPRGSAWVKWTLASYFPVEYQGKPALLIWFYDITDRKIAEDRNQHLAYHDVLTGLPNRSLFRDRVQHAIASAERERSRLALMFVDLDKFKPVNDRYGHGVGDLLLKAVAERLYRCLRKSDSPARLGGDEFVVLLPAIKTERNALEIAEKIRHEMSVPFEIDGLTLEISASIGVAIYPDHADNAQRLVDCADLAMYYAKAEGRNRVRTYQANLRDVNV